MMKSYLMDRRSKNTTCNISSCHDIYSIWVPAPCQIKKLVHTIMKDTMTILNKFNSKKRFYLTKGIEIKRGQQSLVRNVTQIKTNYEFSLQVTCGQVNFLNSSH